MIGKCYITAVLFALCTVNVQGQCDEIYLSGRVSDTLNNQRFYNLMVINLTTQQGVFGRPSGKFGVYANPGDQIAFSVEGYDRVTITIPESDSCNIDTNVVLPNRVQEISSVEVRPIKSLETIREEREEISMRETRTVTGVDVLQSPITALYERFSKKAQSKRKVAEMEHQDNINAVLKDLLRLYVSYDVVYLEEEEFESFVYFLNIDEDFLRTATDYQLITYIKDKLEHYKSMNPEIFPKQ
ncbi:MAG: hypothetical protein ACQERC_01660 [Bacteroidota bacterium]